MSGADAKLVDRVIAQAHAVKDADDRAALLASLGAIRDPALVDAVMRVYVDGGFDLRESSQIIIGVFAHRETRPRAWQVLRDNFDAVASRIPKPFAGYIAATAAGFCDAAARKDAEDFLRPRVTHLANGDRILDQSLAQVDRCIALRARNADAVAKVFTSGRR